jgi:aminoglycoside phosphotransferase (APT) family kinase protein
MGRADVYLQPQADDPVLTEATVLALVRRHLPAARAVTGVDESGGEARVYIVDGDVIVKTQRPHRLRPRTSLAKEAYLLDRLAGTLGVRVPGVFGYDRAETAQGVVEYLCMSRMPGRAAGHVPVSDPERAVLLRDLGWLLRGLHELALDPPPSALLVPVDADAGQLRQRLALAFADVCDALAGQPGAWALPAESARIAERALAVLPATLTRPPVVVHSNPGPTHTFVDPATRALVGLIDFGDSYLGHPAFDLHRWPAVADRLALHAGYLEIGAPSGEFDRVWTVAMIHADLNAVAARSPHAGEATRDLAKRLADL